MSSEHSLKVVREWLRHGKFSPANLCTAAIIMRRDLQKRRVIEGGPAKAVEALASLLDRELQTPARENERLGVEAGETKLSDEQTGRNLERQLQAQHERTAAKMIQAAEDRCRHATRDHDTGAAFHLQALIDKLHRTSTLPLYGPQGDPE